MHCFVILCKLLKWWDWLLHYYLFLGNFILLVFTNSVFSKEEDYSLEKKVYKYCGVELSYANFKEYIENHGFCFINTLWLEQVLMEFYSDTCPACKRMEPVWNRLSCEAKKLFPELKFAKVWNRIMKWNDRLKEIII